MASIAVLGAGVVGMSTAVNIQERLPTAKVTIIAEKFGNDTTSAGAGGIFCPRNDALPGVSNDVLRRWAVKSFRHYDRLVHSPEAAQAGAVKIDGYEFYDKPIEVPSMLVELLYDCRECTQRELQSCSVKYPFGLYLRTLLVECRRYLPWLMKQFLQNRGAVIERKVNSLEELVGRYDLVVNCTGNGSRILLGDEKIRVQRGQALRVDAPWVKSFYRVISGDVAIVPCFDTVILGVTKQLDDTLETVRQSDSDEILKNTLKLFPSLKDAPIKQTCVAFRPYRDPLRLESEVLQLPNGTLKVVHNYGHGSHGVALSWGTALEAVDLVERMLHEGEATVGPSKL